MTDKPLPRHVAIIMDGNGRWAKSHKLQVAMGHRSGMEAMRDIIRYSSDVGIQALSLYAFSTDNWSRSAQEIAALMALLLEYFNKEIDELHEKNVCIRIMGDKDGMPEPQRAALYAAEARTKDNTGLKLNIAVNYGAKEELLRAARQIAQEACAGALDPAQITQDTLQKRLYTHDLPDVDLLIRTSGEQRLSNFLLYQCAYAEMAFPTVLWPDFTLAHYQKALEDYTKRDRRFGGRKEC